MDVGAGATEPRHEGHLTPYLADAAIARMVGGAFWAGLLHPLTPFDEMSFLLALSILSTFNEPYVRVQVLGAVVGKSLIRV